jgi:hypothetical protein
MSSVIGTHIVSNPGGPVVHVPPNGNPSVSDYSPILNIFEFGYPGSQSGTFANGVITQSTALQVTGLGVVDDGPAINAAIAAIGTSGFTLYFPNGVYKITTAIVNTNGVQIEVAPAAQFTGTNAISMGVASGGTVTGNNIPNFARAVMTTVHTSTTYTGTTTNTLTFGTNATISTQDGVSTLAVGDCVLLQGGTLGSCAITACDTGPWIINAAGAAGAKVVLTRPLWWQTGSIIPILYQIAIGPEGTLFGGTKWTSWASTPAAGVLIGASTTDPLFYPDQVSTQVTFATTNVFVMATVPIRSATASTILVNPISAAGTRVSTASYGVITAPTAGYLTTATFTISALTASMALNASDASSSIVSVVITNRAAAG